MITETLNEKLIKENNALKKEIEILKQNPIVKHNQDKIVINNTSDASIIIGIRKGKFRIPTGKINLTDYFTINELILCKDLLTFLNCGHLTLVDNGK